MANRIEIENVRAGYGAVNVLHGVSIDVGDGETIALLGTNGNGKSTLIKCISGHVKIRQGTLKATVDDRQYDLASMSPEEIVNLGIIVVPEGRRLFPKLTVEENLLLGAYRPKARDELDKNKQFCLEAFPRLRERRNQLAGSMSGGEQQMLALARAVMSAPRILLIDEPSVGLAPILVSRLIEKIAELKTALGLTVLMAEQNFQQAVRIANRGYVLVHGEIGFSAGSVEELSQSDIVRKLYLGID